MFGQMFTVHGRPGGCSGVRWDAIWMGWATIGDCWTLVWDPETIATIESCLKLPEDAQ